MRLLNASWPSKLQAAGTFQPIVLKKNNGSAHQKGDLRERERTCANKLQLGDR